MNFFGVLKRFISVSVEKNDEVNIVDGVVTNGNVPDIVNNVNAIDDNGTSMLAVDLEGYSKDLKNRGLSSRTVKEYVIDIKSFKIDESCLTEDIIAQRFNGLKPSTVRRKLTALKSFAKWKLKTNDDRLFLMLSKMGYF